MSFSTVITFSASAEFTFDTALVEITGGLARLKDLGGATYSTANPTLNSQFQIPMSAFSSFAESKSVSGSDQVKYQLLINGTAYWFNTSSSAWEASDGTYSQANTAAELNSNAATLFSGLSLTGNVWLRIRAFLHSATGATRPTLTSVTVGVTNAEQSDPVPSECLISCDLLDLLGAVPTYDADRPSTLYVKNDRAFMHGSRLIQPFTKQAAFNSSGRAELSIIETESVGEELSFAVTYYEGRSLRQVGFENAVVPDVAAASLDEVTVPKTSSPG